MKTKFYRGSFWGESSYDLHAIDIDCIFIDDKFIHMKGNETGQTIYIPRNTESVGFFDTMDLAKSFIIEKLENKKTKLESKMSELNSSIEKIKRLL